MALLCHCDWQNELEKMKSVTNLADSAILYATDLALVLSVLAINRTDVWTQVCACSFTSQNVAAQCQRSSFFCFVSQMTFK